MCTARPSWKSMTLAEMVYKKSMFNINVHLNGIISINSENRVIHFTKSANVYLTQYAHVGKP